MATTIDTRKLERIYTIPLRKAFDYLRTRRTERAVKLVREFAAKHMKVELENVRISEGVNSLLWRDSIEKPPRRLKVRVVREGEMARIWIIGEEEAVKKAAENAKKALEAKAAEKKAAKPAEKKEAKAGSETAKTGEAAKADAKPAEKKPDAPAAQKPAPEPTAKAPAPGISPPKSQQKHMQQGGRNQI